MVRSLKSQIQKDAKRVFLNLSEFAVMKRIAYWPDGMSKPPVIMQIPVSIDEDANMNSVWNKLKSQQRIGNEQELYQIDVVLLAAFEDFKPMPKKGRRLQIDNAVYDVLSVSLIEGIPASF